MTYRMMNSLLAGAMALSLLGAAPAAAAQMSGQELLSLCTANMGGTGNPMKAAECLGFVVGVADTFDCVEDNHGLTWDSRSAISQPGIVQLVVDYIHAHPTALISGGHYIVGQALSQAFPCGHKTAGN